MFVKGVSALFAVPPANCFAHVAIAAENDNVVATTSYGKVRGFTVGGTKVFKGIPYGDTTAGRNRFLPPKKPASWTGVRDALAFGHTAPQMSNGVRKSGTPEQGEDCLVLNVYTPEAGDKNKRPVMVWLHPGGFISGSGSVPVENGVNLAHNHNLVIVSLNHRLNSFGATYLGEIAGPEFALSGNVGMQDIVAALQWVRENIRHFGGDPDMVTIFGQSGGGRKVATLMAMPDARGLFHRAIVESGAMLRSTTREDAVREAELMMRVAQLQPNLDGVRELQNLPFQKLIELDAAVQKAFQANHSAMGMKVALTEPGMSWASPMVDGKVLPNHPWDPRGPELSADIPLMIGTTHTEETLFDRPTPEKLALTEAELKERTAKRLGVNPDPVIAAFRQIYPDLSPWDLYILIASEHPRGAYARELAKRKVLQGRAPAYVYRFDWETPEGGGHMRSEHGVEVPFVFENIKIAGPLISKMPEAYALSEKVSASWVAFARTGNPNTPKLPNWPAYSVERRETMLFNNECKVEQDPAKPARLAMEKVLKLSS